MFLCNYPLFVYIPLLLRAHRRPKRTSLRPPCQGRSCCRAGPLPARWVGRGHITACGRSLCVVGMPAHLPHASGITGMHVAPHHGHQPHPSCAAASIAGGAAGHARPVARRSPQSHTVGHVVATDAFVAPHRPIAQWAEPSPRAVRRLAPSCMCCGGMVAACDGGGWAMLGVVRCCST